MNNINIDSLKLKIKNITAFAEEKFIKNDKYYRLTKKELGLNNIIIFQDSNTAIVEISSKILKHKYFQGINDYTITDVIDILRNYIEFQLEDVEVLKVDIYKHLQIENKKDFINQLKVLNRTNKYKLVEFHENESAVFEKDNKKSKDRIIFYDKEAEMEKAIEKENDEEKREILLRVFESKQFKNVIRIELNIKTFDKMRSFLHITSNSLIDVITADADPVKKILDTYFINKQPKSIADEEERHILYYCYEIEKRLLDIESIEKAILQKYNSKYLQNKELTYFEKAKEKIKKEYHIENFDILKLLRTEAA